MAYNVKSYDDGFGDGKGFDGKTELIIPSFVTKWQPIPEGEFAKSQYSEPESHITVEYEGSSRKHLIGKGAQSLDKVGDWVGEENKHKSRKFIPILKGQLALLCQNEIEKVVHIDPLVMGLPLEQDTEERQKDLVELVKGKHEVKVTLADGTVIEKEIHVDSVVVLNQPIGSFFYMALDNNGAIKDESLLNQVTVVFDLGARTLNVLTLRGFTPISNLSFTKQLGIYESWESIRSDIKEYHKKELPLARIPQYCEDGYISGGIDISELRDENYADHADTVLSVFGKEFIHNIGEVDNIILTGGGSEVLRKWLEPGMRSRFKNAKIQSLGRTATVKGYYNFGMRIARSSSNKAKKQVAAAKEE